MKQTLIEIAKLELIASFIGLFNFFLFAFLGEADIGYLFLLMFIVFIWFHLSSKEQIRDLEKFEAEIKTWTKASSNNIFIFDEEGRILSIPNAQDCKNCRYFYGRDGIVCAVHPNGYKEESCIDRAEK